MVNRSKKQITILLEGAKYYFENLKRKKNHKKKFLFLTRNQKAQNLNYNYNSL